MAERPVYIGGNVTTKSATSPGISGSSATGQALSGLASVLSRAGEGFARVEEAEALEVGRQTAIAEVEQSGTFEPVRKPGTFWRQYNQAGMAAFGQEIELSARQNIARIAAENRNDPRVMEGALAKFAGAMVESVPTEMRGGFRRDFEVWSRPHVTSAINRELELADKSAKYSLIALTDQRATDARGIGEAIAAANPETDAGMQAVVAAGRSLADLYTSTVDHLAGMVANKHITAGEAEQLISQQRASITSNLLVGAFDGSDDKGQFLIDFVSGDLTLPVPKIDEETGEIIFTAGNPLEALDAAQFDSVRSHMATRVSAIQSTKAAAREAMADGLEAEGDALLSQFASTRDPAMLSQIEAHPGISLAEKANARGMMRDEGAGSTDWSAFEDVQAMIAVDPAGITIGDIRGGPFRRTEQEALLKALEERQSQDHFANQPGYRQAELRVDRVVGQISSDVVQVIGGTSAEASSSRTRAAALLKQRLYDETLRAQRAGFVIGQNPSGRIIEQVGDQSRFDPEAWMTTKVATLREAAVQRIAPLNEKRARLREIQVEQTKAISEGDSALANQLASEMIQLMSEVRDASRGLDLSDLVMTEEVTR